MRIFLAVAFCDLPKNTKWVNSKTKTESQNFRIEKHLNKHLVQVLYLMQSYSVFIETALIPATTHTPRSIHDKHDAQRIWVTVLKL